MLLSAHDVTRAVLLYYQTHRYTLSREGVSGWTAGWGGGMHSSGDNSILSWFMFPFMKTNLKIIRGQTLSFGLYDIRPLGEQFIHGCRAGYGRVVLNKHINQVPRPPTDLQCCAHSHHPVIFLFILKRKHQHIVYSSNPLGLGDGGRSGYHSNQDAAEIRRHKIVCAARGMAVNSHLDLAITQGQDCRLATATH
ncbi:hypothetical protein GWK47_006921 [Chionoecetes opilio]|uniref:Uncharacterized protein n=1 Tax=Chionoecetes opilio TaxID=41210 RepID=A0A8J5CUE8_CHIOP|nr:hypothetical protein GWK47_006921 [Chionoecetes opilio]